MSQKNKPYMVFLNSVTTGFIGGISLAIIYSISAYINVTNITYQDILAFFLIEGRWLESWYGFLFYLCFTGVLSVVLAMFYYGILRQFNGLLSGFLFGFILWIVIAVIIPITMFDIPLTSFLKSYTNVLNLCVLLLYGIFLGYSISYDAKINKVS